LKDIEIYRAEFAASIKPAVYCSLVTGIIFFSFVFIKEGFQLEQRLLQATFILVGTLIFFLLGLIAGITYFYKITISKNGLSSYNPWETFKCYHMDWSEMEDIKLRSVFGYKYYYIWSSTLQKDLWLPYQIKNKKAFLESCRKHAGDNSLIIKTTK
jgi:uncharacterized membrane protein